MTETFNTKSIKVKPDTASICQASAEDFYVEDDFRWIRYFESSDCLNHFEFWWSRMRVCTKITHDDLITVHQKMSQIQYFMGYKELHWTFRRAANPGKSIAHDWRFNAWRTIVATGFYEAVGGAVGLSVATPSHLKELGFLEETGGTESSTKLFDDLPDLPDNVTPQDMNFLLSQALDKVISYCEFKCKPVSPMTWGFIAGCVHPVRVHGEPVALVGLQWKYTKWGIEQQMVGNEKTIPRFKCTRWEKQWNWFRRWFLVPYRCWRRIRPVMAKSNTSLSVSNETQLVFQITSRYLVGSILQFQIYESLCNISGYTDLDKSLYKCDLSKHTTEKVGAAMK